MLHDHLLLINCSYLMCSICIILLFLVLEEIKPENSLGYKQWIFCLELCELMYFQVCSLIKNIKCLTLICLVCVFNSIILYYFQGLLDRQEFLQWILELVEKCRYPDDPMMRIVMPLMLQYAKEFVQVIQN